MYRYGIQQKIYLPGVHLACLKPYTRSFYVIVALHLLCDAVAYALQEHFVKPFGHEGFDDPDLEYPYQPKGIFFRSATVSLALSMLFPPLHPVMVCIFLRKFVGLFIIIPFFVFMGHKDTKPRNLFILQLWIIFNNHLQ